MLTSRQNSLVKRVRRLHQTQGREADQLLLLEGTHVIQEAIAAGLVFETLCYTAPWQQRYPTLWETLQGRLGDLPMVEVSPEVLAAMATTQTPDGVLALAPRTPPCPATLPCSLALALDRLQDPGNLGTILRTAVATGVEGIWLNRTGVAYDHPKVIRASAGQWFRLPMAVHEDLVMTVREAQQSGMQVVAMRSESSRSYWEMDWTRPSLILLGSEGAGLARELEAIADDSVQIPLQGGVESLNVAIAAAVILYEVQRQRGVQLRASVHSGP